MLKNGHRCPLCGNDVRPFSEATGRARDFGKKDNGRKIFCSCGHFLRVTEGDIYFLKQRRQEEKIAAYS